ncbi:hypothetical protein LEN26_020075 [Aphanomyces euteiches]|nr:hypothetical protein LEN26_020075 [Aphanomyces euteiches]KAH9115333.1 hypothetical protein AeMF1_010599 [Aphanomyces euteiches]KAH9196736.1 hypothetical protein AeNC1_001310 [Aphanomyces euteiches]
MAMTDTSDHGVAETAYDAIHCKISAINLGYFEDPFAKLFEKKATRRIPLIHRGYYLRHVAVEHAVHLFLQNRTPGRSAQIVSLGAGFDTLFFRLTQQEQHADLRMFEVDCTAITRQKIDVLQANTAALFGPASETTQTGTTFAATVPELNASYAALSCDLGDLDSLKAQLASQGLDYTHPTLFLAECVLAYLTPEASTAILGWASSAFSDSMVVTYDPVGLNKDGFGQQMHRYFEAKGCTLRSALLKSSIPDYTTFLTTVGWLSIRLHDMNAIYNALVDGNERQRIASLEPFDEFEDWKLTNHHYAVLVATNRTLDATGSAAAAAVAAWPTTTALSGIIHAYSLPTSNGVLRVRPFQESDLLGVRSLFESVHGELIQASKSVRKLAAKALETDLADVNHYYLRPGTAAGFWVATDQDNSLVGIVGLKPLGDDGELCRLAVDPKMRKCRVATRLVDELERYGAAVGFDQITLETLDQMHDAQAFYAARGYVVVSSNRVGKPPDEIVLDRLEKRVKTC